MPHRFSRAFTDFASAHEEAYNACASTTKQAELLDQVIAEMEDEDNANARPKAWTKKSFTEKRQVRVLASASPAYC